MTRRIINYIAIVTIIYLTIINLSNAQELKQNYRSKLYNYLRISRAAIESLLDGYFWDSNNNILNDTLRPSYLKSYEYNKKIGNYCPIIIGLELKIECSEDSLQNLFIENIKGLWISNNSNSPRTDRTSIPLEYHECFSERIFRLQIRDRYSLAEDKEKDKHIYSAKLIMNLNKCDNDLCAESSLCLMQWSLKNNNIILTDSVKINLQEQRIDSVFKSVEIRKDSTITPQDSTRTPKDTPLTLEDSIKVIKIESPLLAINFFDILDKILIQKQADVSSILIENFISALTDSLNNRLKVNNKKVEYFKPRLNYLLSQFFKNYLMQPNVVILNNELQKCKQQTFDNQNGVKFDYFIKDGTKKIGTYIISNHLRTLNEYKCLPIEIIRKFDSNYYIDAEELIKNNFHSLSIKNGNLLNLTIINESSSNDITYAMKNYSNYIMWFDIVEFFSRYATAIIIQDNYSLSNAWYNKAIRITYYDSAKQVSKKQEEIAKRLMNIGKYRYTWVNYYLLRDQIRRDYEVKFYSWDLEGFQEIMIFQNINIKPNVVALIPMYQQWFNFDRNKNELTYASVDTVDFYLNIFNVNLAISYLSSERRLYPDDYFGIMIYLKYLFQDDNRFLWIKNKYRNKAVFQKFLSLEDPEPQNIPNFIKRKFDSQYLNNDEKNDLLTFFQSKDYEYLHLAYNVFHQAFIQILGSITRPPVPPEHPLFRKFFNEISN